METKVHLVGLPEDVIREIFRHLNDNEVYFKLRRVCHKLMDYVDAYVQLGGTFMLAGEPDTPTKIINVFKQSLHIT